MKHPIDCNCNHASHIRAGRCPWLQCPCVRAHDAPILTDPRDPTAKLTDFTTIEANDPRLQPDPAIEGWIRAATRALVKLDGMYGGECAEARAILRAAIEGHYDYEP